MRIILERAYWQSVIGGLARKKVPVIPFVPVHREAPRRRLEVLSAWEGNESILSDLIKRFQLNTDCCLEFGVEFGFSTVALSSYFDSVIGVDTFMGDKHTANKENIYQETVKRLSPYENIQLVRSDYKDFIRSGSGEYNLIHVDIVHTFADTFACGLWSVRHSQCTIFHDTESFPQVKEAVSEIARVTGKKLYNFHEGFGLGIVV